MPGRPYIIGAAILIAFGYQFWNRKSKGGDDDEGSFKPSKKSGYGKYGAPASKFDAGSKFGNPGGKYGAADPRMGGRGAPDFDRIRQDMGSVGTRTQAIEQRMAELGSMTSELSSALGTRR